MTIKAEESSMVTYRCECWWIFDDGGLMFGKITFHCPEHNVIVRHAWTLPQVEVEEEE